jgi:hypothetical protein
VAAIGKLHPCGNFEEFGADLSEDGFPFHQVECVCHVNLEDPFLVDGYGGFVAEDIGCMDDGFRASWNTYS